MDNINGWAIGDPQNPDDKKDADHLYSIIEEKVLTTFYNDRDKWIFMMKEAIKTGIRFTAHRMIKEYNRKYYRLGD